VRACVHSVGMLCGYMPNSSLFVCGFVGLFVGSCPKESTHNSLCASTVGLPLDIHIAAAVKELYQSWKKLHCIITLRAKLSGAVYCNRSCLCVCLFVCGFVGLLPR